MTTGTECIFVCIIYAIWNASPRAESVTCGKAFNIYTFIFLCTKLILEAEDRTALGWYEVLHISSCILHSASAWAFSNRPGSRGVDILAFYRRERRDKKRPLFAGIRVQRL